MPVDRGKIAAARRSRDRRRYVCIGRVNPSFFLIRTLSRCARTLRAGDGEDIAKCHAIPDHFLRRDHRFVNKTRGEITRASEYRLNYLGIYIIHSYYRVTINGMLEARGSTGSWKLDARLDFRLALRD